MATLHLDEKDDFKFSVANVFHAIKECMKWELEVGETLTLTEAAKYLDVSKQRIIQLVHAERLRSAKFGRNTFVPLADVKAYKTLVKSGQSVGGRGHKASPVFE
jgi:excisionase family DNA binding protein